MAKAKTKKYVVTQPNTLEYEVGEVVSLTDQQAVRLVNKVREQDTGARSVVPKAEAALAKKLDVAEAARDGLAELVRELEDAAGSDAILAGHIKGARERVAAKAAEASNAPKD